MAAAEKKDAPVPMNTNSTAQSAFAGFGIGWYNLCAGNANVFLVMNPVPKLTGLHQAIARAPDACLRLFSCLRRKRAGGEFSIPGARLAGATFGPFMFRLNTRR